MGDRFRNLIDGKWVESANGTAFDDINPANRADVVGTFPRSDHRDVDRAVEAARTQFASWSRVPSLRRSEILYHTARIAEERAEGLAGIIVRETGKLLSEAQTELRDGVSLLRAIAAEATRPGGAVVPSVHPEALALAIQTPVGVAAVITHWTFPLAGSIWALASALAAGNTVVFKPAEDTPLVGMRLVEILQEAGLPPGTISLVHGYGEEAGAPLVRHPDVVLVSFTGSSDVGREVAITCAAEQKRLALDLGQRCVVLVLEDADLDLAVEGAVRGVFAMAGQRWRGAARVFVHRKAAREFADRVVARVQALRLGDGMLPTTDVGPVISETQLKRVHGHTRIGVRDGAKLLCGGEVVRDGDCKRGFFYAPTVFGDAALKMRIVQEEVLGPTLALLAVAGVDEAVEQATAVRHDVTTAVYTRDLARAFRVIENLRAGCAYVNPTPTGGDARLSFTDYGQLKRLHREAVGRSIDGFAAWKEVIIDSVGGR